MHLAEAESSPAIEVDSEFPAPGLSAEMDFSRRVEARGKFLFLGEEKFWVKGVTYGTFSPNSAGEPFPEREIVAADFSAMSAAGINTVRTYSSPPVWLLDLAMQSHLRVMVGIAWEQHVAFLDDRVLRQSIKKRVREDVRSRAGHPAILCFSIGNEIPSQIVRWHGRRKIESFLRQLYKIAKREDPDVLVTYVNYPTTEYLQLHFLDLCCFNVYLEQEEELQNYLARLQNLATDKPLVMAEIGLDSQRNGEQEQATQLAWQIRTAFAAGCAGTLIFAWTDEWYRGGFEIEDWDFGLCRRDRSPKPALAAVQTAFSNAPFAVDFRWPRISVVVCTYNGASTIRDTLESLLELDYPDYEVIVVNDGSTDDTAEVVREYRVVPISTENRGLSSARNTGWQMATGDIVAYIDDDAYPDPHWLNYLAYTYLTTDYVAVGGLSLAPPGGGSIADCVANAPGRPVHVLLTDREAEHIPGCNMSFRRSVLEEVGGFDPRFRTAGDDVDICWRILDRGWKIGFHPGAQNWHHCRNVLRTYWKQQQGYGKAEALLEEKWPDKYNSAGHLTWQGRLYGRGFTEPLPTGRWKIYQGRWGSALFQSIYQPAAGWLSSLPLMPEWYFVIGTLAYCSLMGLVWKPLLATVPILTLAVLAPVTQAILSAIKADFPTPHDNRWRLLVLRAVSTILHLMQPLARLIGRLRHGLTPWRIRTGNGKYETFKTTKSLALWSEKWQSPDVWLDRVEGFFKTNQKPVVAGGDFDIWDLEIRGGLLGSTRLRMAIEEHGEGKQLIRFSLDSVYSRWGLLLAFLFGSSGVIAGVDNHWTVAVILVGISVAILARSYYESLNSMTAFLEALKVIEGQITKPREAND